jgi:hypothetical protein
MDINQKVICPANCKVDHFNQMLKSVSEVKQWATQTFENIWTPHCTLISFASWKKTRNILFSSWVIYRSNHYLSIYGSTVLLLDLDRFFSFLIYTQSVGLLGRGISQSQGRYLITEQHKHRMNAHRHPCLEWDTNPRTQCSSERRQLMP